jgi:DNA-binding transcriptional ArsR family regulator
MVTQAESHSETPSSGLLSPLRRRVLEQLESPDSASGLAKKLGIARQKINYHLRELERTGLVELVEERQRRGCVERVVRVTGRAFAVSSSFLQALGTTPEQARDNFSSAYLVHTAATTARDVALLREQAKQAQKRLATLALETEINFESPSAFKEFTDELLNEVSRIAAKYNRPDQKNARRFRVAIASHPVIPREATQTTESTSQRKIGPDALSKKSKESK